MTRRHRMNPASFQNLLLRGGFLLRKVVLTDTPLRDAMGRLALARTTITGVIMEVEISGAPENAEEHSISLYHEILEGASVAATNSPPAVCELNEAGYEAAARDYHRRLGPASPDRLNEMLAGFGF